MRSFTETLVIQFEAGNRWMLAKEFTYHVGHVGSGETITVPVGFTTDLASIPALFLPFVANKQEYQQAAVLHDWLVNKPETHPYNHKEASKIFYEAMLVLGVPKYRARSLYWAVLFFGVKSKKMLKRS